MQRDRSRNRHYRALVVRQSAARCRIAAFDVGVAARPARQQTPVFHRNLGACELDRRRGGRAVIVGICVAEWLRLTTGA
jgi:hypothetical protein